MRQTEGKETKRNETIIYYKYFQFSVKYISPKGCPPSIDDSLQFQFHISSTLHSIFHSLLFHLLMRN